MELNSLLQQITATSSADTIHGLQKKLEHAINELINSNFEKLVQLLYRVDVDEEKVKTLLRQHPGEDAAKIIAALLITRQIEKETTKKRFTQNNSGDEEEKW
jgi:hypothetical protein